MTRAVAPLDPESIATALDRGLVAARSLVARGMIVAAALHLQGVTRVDSSLMALEARDDVTMLRERLDA